MVKGLPIVFAMLLNICLFAGIGKLLFEHAAHVEDNYFTSFS